MVHHKNVVSRFRCHHLSNARVTVPLGKTRKGPVPVSSQLSDMSSAAFVSIPNNLHTIQVSAKKEVYQAVNVSGSHSDLNRSRFKRTSTRPFLFHSPLQLFPHCSLQTTANLAKGIISSDMGSDVTIRSACQSDVEDLHAISLCPGVRFNTSKMPYVPITKVKRELENPRPGDWKLVAVIENRVVGTVGIHVNPNPARTHAAYIGMAVHDEFQGRGIGTLLLREAIDLAERWMGLRRLELEVFSRNTRALELYKRHGFEAEGHLKDYAFRDGEFVDAVSMARVNGLERYSQAGQRKCRTSSGEA